MLNKNTLPSQHLSEFVAFVTETMTNYKIYLDEMNEQNRLTQDLLHKLELDDLSANEKRKITTQLVTNRKDRRYFKDRVEELEPIVKFFEEPQNKTMLNKLKQVLGECRKTESYHENRQYKPKVKKE